MDQYRDAWNSPLVQDIRRELSSGQFHKYCLDSPACPIVRKDSQLHQSSVPEVEATGVRAEAVEVPGMQAEATIQMQTSNTERPNDLARSTHRGRLLIAVVRRAGIGYAWLFVLDHVLQRLKSWLITTGPSHRTLDRLATSVDSAIQRTKGTRVNIERRRGLSERWTASANRFTAHDNRGWWNNHDWSKLGEEWTPDAGWKDAIIERFLRPHVPENSTVLEIGPGGGRWTEVLLGRAQHLYVLDLAEKPLTICRDRFAESSSMLCIRGDGRTIPLRTDSVDCIWSYDVFVHVNPLDASSYFSEFGRVLRSGGYAVIHHPGHESTSARAMQHRSDLTDQMVKRFAESNNLVIVMQTDELVNTGDMLTVLRKL